MSRVGKVIGILAGVVVLAAVAAVAAGQAGLLKGTAPTDLGVRDGRLKPPATTPNSVSSQAGLHADNPRAQAAAIAPLALAGTQAETMSKLGTVLAAMPGAKIITESADYVYAQFTSRWMGYVDDVEFWADPAAQVLQVRSASRLGESDLGANRKRVEAIRAALAGAQ